MLRVIHDTRSMKPYLFLVIQIRSYIIILEFLSGKLCEVKEGWERGQRKDKPLLRLSSSSHLSLCMKPLDRTGLRVIQKYVWSFSSGKR